MEPLSGMNGPLCPLGALRREPENTGERSHEGETEDTPWRHVGTAKVWAAASGPLYPPTGRVLKNKAGAEKQFVYLMQEPWCVVPDCFHLHLLSGSRPFTLQTVHKRFKQGTAFKPHAFHPPITTWCKPLSPDTVFVNISNRNISKS